MPDAPEIPEAKDPFEKRVALTIAIIAICLSFVGNLGDNAKTDAIIKTNEASDQWGFFQAKSLKSQIAATHGDLLTRLSNGALSEETKAEAADLKKKAERYEAEENEIKSKAEALQTSAAHASAINDRCDESALLLQISVVVCSVSILAQSHKFWWLGMLLGTAGMALGATAFML